MSDPFLAEIRAFGFAFAPRGWASCDGQTLPIQQNVALFSLLGVTYGGDGISTFKLPNFVGMAPMAAGQGAGLTQRYPGNTGGSQTVTLTTSTMGPHNHTLSGRNALGNQSSPAATYSVALPAGTDQLYSTGSGAQMNPQALTNAGNGAAHNNMQPYQNVFFAIALQGIFPQRP